MKYMTPILKSQTLLVQDCEATGGIMRTMRETAEVSLRSVAKTMGITPAYLSDLERGRRAWNDKLCKRFQEALRK